MQKSTSYQIDMIKQYPIVAISISPFNKNVLLVAYSNPISDEVSVVELIMYLTR